MSYLRASSVITMTCGVEYGPVPALVCAATIHLYVLNGCSEPTVMLVSSERTFNVSPDTSEVMLVM